jgi:glucosyl-dolichyl phosphate glucuronosyltransferase
VPLPRRPDAAEHLQSFPGRAENIPVTSVSVVICAYTEERWGSLVSGIAATLAQSIPPREVIVVCDHNDVLRARLERELAGVRVIENDLAQGLSGARNSGVAAATGEIVAFLDDDAVPEHDWLEQLTVPFSDARIIGTGGQARPRWTTSRPGWFPDEFLWIVGCSYRGLPESVAPIRNPIGATMAFRRQAIADVGGFAVYLGRIGKTPLGCEETELSIRVLRANPGSRIVLVPTARVDHEVTGDRATWRYFRARCFAEGLSKAAVSGLVGADDALSSERSYVSRTLPAGVLRGLRDALRGKGHGLARAAAIVAGLIVTAAGYARGRSTLVRATSGSATL